MEDHLEVSKVDSLLQMKSTSRQPLPMRSTCPILLVLITYGYGVLATSAFAAANGRNGNIYELLINGLLMHPLLQAYAMLPYSMANPHSGAYSTYALIQWKELQIFMSKPLLV